VKIALAQLNYHIGNFQYNTEKIIRHVQMAKEQGADCVVFGELSVCGYPPRDFLEFEDFIDQTLESIQKIANASQGITTIVGGPARNPRVEGKNLFNAAYVLRDGKIESEHHKALLPNYDVFDEYRYFEPAREFQIAHIAGKKVALPICEDLWDVEEDLMYTIWPMDELKKQGAELIINIAASPFNYGHAEKRREVMKRNVEKYKMPLVYIQHVGAHTEIIFDGGSFVMNEKGNVVEQLSFFEEDFRIVDSSRLSTSAARHGAQALSQTSLPSKESRIHDALVLGIKDYFDKMGFSKAILGLSGGVDSALVLALAVEALGKENVLPVLMPSEFSSAHSVDDSVQMCNNIGMKYEIIPIRKGFDATLEMLKPVFGDAPFNVAEENIQARMRAIILMGIANKKNYILLNTTNKSEAAVGYGTLYGDMCGGIAVLADLYKMEVYALCDFINRDKEIIPKNILTKAPSAELRPGQKDSDSLPEYPVLDKILYAYIEQRQGPKEIIAMGFEAALVHRVLKMVNSNEWKRAQMAPVLRVSPKAFGSGRRMPIVGKYLG
jgi:NAD+ synthase (glutamine-hydrolysing)